MVHVVQSPQAVGSMNEPVFSNQTAANVEEHETRLAAVEGSGGGGTGYVKPSGGIPESDLASAVQTKLDATGGGGYVKPSGGIPETDLTTALQTKIDASGGASLTITPGYDIFILAGQSNMAGAGYNYDLVRYEPPQPKILQWGSINYPGQVTVAVSPYDHPDWILGPGTKGIGPGEGFAQYYEMYMQPGRKILFVPTAYGGTGFEAQDAHSLNRYWKVSTAKANDPGGTGRLDLYRQSVELAKAALAGSPPGSAIVGVLWHQGEQDSGITSTSAYQTDLDALIAAYRSDLSLPNLPLVVGQMTYEVRTMDAAHIAIDGVHVNTGLRSNQYTACAFGPLGGYSDPTNGTVHYSAAGQRLQGRAYYEAFIAALTNTTAAAPVAPGSVRLTQLTSTSAMINWIPLGGRPTDYTVQYTINAGSTWTTVTHTASPLPYLTVTGITAGSTVQARVAQVTASSSSSYATSASVVLASAPGQVTGVTTGTPGASSVPLSWTATSGATAYSIDYSANAGSTWTNFSTVVSTNSATVTGLAGATSYVFRVSASNAWGTGTTSTTTSSVTTGSGAASFSDTFNRTASTAGTNWTAPVGGATFPTNGTVLGIANSSTSALTTYLCIATTGAYTATSAADAFVQMDIVARSGNTVSGSTPGYPYVVLNYTDVNNYYTATFAHVVETSTTGTWTVSKNLAGTTTTLFTGSTITEPTLPVTVRLAIVSGVLTLYINGSSVGTYTDSSPLTGTQAGIKIRAGGGSGAAALTEQQQVDNFSAGAQ